MEMCMFFMCSFFFFFKQKTADELRISDWSSDVCSSDLGRAEGTARVGDRYEQGQRVGEGGTFLKVFGGSAAFLTASLIPTPVRFERSRETESGHISFLDFARNAIGSAHV